MDWIFYLTGGAAALIAGLALFLNRRRELAEAAQSLADTLASCQVLLALTGHFQQHRGMSSAWLAGDRAFGDRLEAKAGEIEARFAALQRLANRECARSHPCLTPNELALFRHHWGQLREKLPHLSVEQSIAQHSLLIEQLLHWLAALGEARVEPLLGSDRALVRNYASRLPALTECLGQARAVGMSVAARQACSAVARVRLMFLIARAETLLSQAAEGGVRSARGEAAQIAVQQMARLVRTRMLVSAGVSVSADEYFATATQAVDAVFAWIADTGERLGEQFTAAAGGRPEVHAYAQ